MNVKSLNESCDGSSDADLPLDVQLASSSRELLHQRIRFVEAKRQDSQYEELKKRYKPLNDPLKEKGAGSGTPLSSNSVETDDSKGDGVCKPRVELFPVERVEMQWKASRRVGSGLANLGNTCFLNSVMQCMTYTAPLINYLQSGDHTRQCRMVGFCAMCEVKRHIDVVLTASGKVVRPTGIVQRLKNIAKHFRVGRQEDAHEFLRYLIDRMQKSCLSGYLKLDPTSQGTSIVHRIFGGYHRSQVKCLKCRHESNTYEQLLDISLNIKSCLSVKRALEKFIEPEMLDGVNRYLCFKCKQKVPAQKTLTIHRAPNVLTLQMKRFEFYSLFGSKLSKEVKYDEKLDLRPFMSCKKGPPEMYQLYAVLVHAGSSCNSGHYYCYVRSPGGHWYCMNDAQVYHVNISTVLGQQAYLLFYARMKVRRESPTSLKTAAVKPILPAGTVGTPLHHFIGPIKPDVKPVNSTIMNLPTGKLVSPQPTSAGKCLPSGSLSFTPQPLKTFITDDTKYQASNRNKELSEQKPKGVTVSLAAIKKPTAVVQPSPVSHEMTHQQQAEIVNSKNVSSQSHMWKSSVKSAASSGSSQTTKSAMDKLNEYESSDSDKCPSPARIEPATSTTSDCYAYSPDGPHEAELTSVKGTQVISDKGMNSKSRNEIEEVSGLSVESLVWEADQSSESQVVMNCSEITEKSSAKDRKKKKKKHKKHKKAKKAEKQKLKNEKGDRDKHRVAERATVDNTDKHHSTETSDIQKRKRKLMNDDSNAHSFCPPLKEARGSDGIYKHRHKHHSSSFDSTDRGRRDSSDTFHSCDRQHRCENLDEDSGRSRHRNTDSREHNDRRKAKATKSYSYVPERHQTPEKHQTAEKYWTDRHFEKQPEKIHWRDAMKKKGIGGCSYSIRDGSRHNDVLSELTKSSLQGYGKSVQSWDGKQSVVDMAVDEDQRHRKRSRDVWDEEYDKGKMKKVKMSRTAIMRDNIFQKVQSIKNRLGQVKKDRSR
ncbi:ubiquitin carboxyl-terminal hydrolase 36-like isoform X2 [Corticium candelabrum]|uniref:ubiquitin carboxyl-terminal hydrolase 36-like isoform X2 n=1 Tax=Corticium candelabrum TaxID=121492 RepID=UPI002E30D721|nr:ubiquitin carboxyl-terminal hydrolase 36-like isoform X2 [Corticium candelabrum]